MPINGAQGPVRCSPARAGSGPSPLPRQRPEHYRRPNLHHPEKLTIRYLVDAQDLCQWAAGPEPRPLAAARPRQLQSDGCLGAAAALGVNAQLGQFYQRHGRRPLATLLRRGATFAGSVGRIGSGWTMA